MKRYDCLLTFKWNSLFLPFQIEMHFYCTKVTIKIQLQWPWWETMTFYFAISFSIYDIYDLLRGRKKPKLTSAEKWRERIPENVVINVSFIIHSFHIHPNEPLQVINLQKAIFRLLGERREREKATGANVNRREILKLTKNSTKKKKTEKSNKEWVKWEEDAWESIAQTLPATSIFRFVFISSLLRSSFMLAECFGIAIAWLFPESNVPQYALT